VDPEAVTPYVCRFEQGTGRHDKDGVRIGVGQVGRSILVALPGPNAEVRLGMAAVIRGLAEGWDKERLAAEVARPLREHLREKMHQHPTHVGIERQLAGSARASERISAHPSPPNGGPPRRNP
jgi:hypothetical protein